MGNRQIQDMVESFCNHPTSELRNSIISECLSLVRSIITNIPVPNEPLAQQEDLESVGVIGVIDALDYYDCSKNIQFTSFAYYRIRGNVIDYLREIDPLSRLQRKRYAQIQKFVQRKSQELGHEPREDVVANEMDMTRGEYWQLLARSQNRYLRTLDNFSDNNYNIFEDQNSFTPESSFERKEAIKILKYTISQLKNQHKLILKLYYFEGMKLRNVGLLFEISEARTSQIKSKFLLQLKTQLMSLGFSMSDLVD